MNIEIEGNANFRGGNNQPKRVPDNFEEEDEDQIDDIDENMDAGEGKGKDTKGNYQSH
jgi:hypothetical protein